MNRLAEQLHKFKFESRYRKIPDNKSADSIDLVSNDYLGLAEKEKELKAEFLERFPEASFSSSAARLLSRKQEYHFLLERLLESLYGKAILLYNSGYHANAGIISALSSPGTLFLVDRMMHASGYDGLMLGKQHRKAEYIRFPHNDINALRNIIETEKLKDPYREIIIITESIFSMDGDIVPLKEIVDLKKTFPDIIIYLDEAHAVGVRGEKGLGYAIETGLLNHIDILVGTFGKAFASTGAFVATTEEIREFLINTSRSFIFSTALPPVNAAWSYFMVEKVMAMDKEREHLQEISRDFAALLNKKSVNYVSGRSQIIPFICGSAENAVNTAKKLRENGFDVLPIRYPTVPKGEERIRFSLNSGLFLSDLSRIPEVIESL